MKGAAAESSAPSGRWVLGTHLGRRSENPRYASRGGSSEADSALPQTGPSGVHPRASTAEEPC
jgi:hypothetical protein